MSGQTAKVVVIGGAYVDMAIRCSRFPAAGQTVPGTSLSYTTTGPGPNQAVEAALCGCEVHLISKIGGDPFGQTVLASLRKLGVDTEHVVIASAKNTGVTVTLVDGSGENAACWYNGANSALVPADIELAEPVISEADVCLIHGRLPQDAIVSAIRCAKLHGATVILNPARPLQPTGGTEPAELPSEYFSADILIPNLFEAADITYQASASIRTAKMIGSELVARGVKYAVITMGRRGCMVVDRTSADHIPAFEIELVDQTARGDAFAGALAASCAVGDEIRQAVTFASAAGALACTKFGSIESLPNKAEIIELLQREDIDRLPSGQ